MERGEKITVIMPAYNAEKTLEKTVNDTPKDIVDEIILVDDCSQDKTAEIAHRLGIKVFIHHSNTGYGGNQKTCYTEALKGNPDVVVMIHPDYQYDASKIPQLIKPIINGECDAVFGSRMLEEGALKGGMPIYKYISNKFLTFLENLVFCLGLSEYHTGLRAYSRRLLETVPWQNNSNDFVFDSEIIAQAVFFGFKIQEIAIPTRYFKEASSVNFINSCIYGLKTLNTLAKFLLHRWKLISCPLFVKK